MRLSKNNLLQRVAQCRARVRRVSEHYPNETAELDKLEASLHRVYKAIQLSDIVNAPPIDHKYVPNTPITITLTINQANLLREIILGHAMEGVEAREPVRIQRACYQIVNRIDRQVGKFLTKADQWIHYERETFNTN